jgi:hypothetical protein
MVSSLVIFIDSKENSVGQNLVAGSNSIWFDQIDIYLTFKSELFCQSKCIFSVCQKSKTWETTSSIS